MNPMYDVVILGCGEAGIFAAYELARLHPDLKITALDQGRDIYHRSCPIVAGKVKECIHCPVCDKMCIRDRPRTAVRRRGGPPPGWRLPADRPPPPPAPDPDGR